MKIENGDTWIVIRHREKVVYLCSMGAPLTLTMLLNMARKYMEKLGYRIVLVEEES